MNNSITVKFFDTNGRSYNMDVTLDTMAVSYDRHNGQLCVSHSEAEYPRPIGELIERGECEFYVSDGDDVSPTYWYGCVSK